MYCYIPSRYLREVDALLNGEEFGKYMSNDTHGIISLGYFNEGDELTFTLSIGEEGTYLGNSECYFFLFNEELFVDTMAKLSDSGYEIDECTEDYFSGKIKVRSGEETTVTSIPYDAGWTVTCDGVEVETYEVLDALLAFDLPEGEHTLTLRYMPKEYKVGAAISAVSCAVFAVILLADCFVTRRKRNAERVCAK